MSFYKVAVVVVRAVCRLIYRFKVEGIENVPKDRPFIVCANHKSLMDPILLAVSLPAEFRFMAKEELFKNKLFGWFLRALGAFPVKRRTSDIGALKLSMKILSEGGRLIIFPEGSRSPKGYMGEAKGGATLVAIKSQADIVPVGIKGEYKLFSKLTVRIGEPVSLSQWYGQKVNSEGLLEITNTKIMKVISELSEVPVYEDRDCK